MTAPLQRVFAVWFAATSRWDVKGYTSRLAGSFPLVGLRGLVRERSERVNLFEFVDTTFRILGVSNDGGIFHAYDALGSKIHQPYKKVESGDFFYNPYRVNVGSIGIVPQELGGNYASPAYVVFSVDQTRILPTLLAIILKAKWYNPTLRAATAGSVRQNLTFELLQTLQIPLPPLVTQRAILAEWQKARQAIAAAEENARKIEAEIEVALYGDLGTPQPKPAAKRERFMPLQWADIDRWSFNYLSRVRSGMLGFRKSRFPIVPMEQCIVETRNGFCIKPVAGPTPHKMLKLNALTPGGLDTTASKYIRVSEKTAVQFHIRAGDLLICRSVGSYDHIAKCAVVQEDDTAILYPDIMIRVRFTAAVMPDYVRELVQSSVGRSHFQSNARTAVGMWKIGSEDIRSFRLPLPPLDVQRRITEKVTDGRARIACERETARTLVSQIESDMEAYLLGTKKVPGVN
ncbi:MAG: restriction endonuclease subunit S [Kiritimatiellae bacterium]|nr:restriction endonuclease subunit S [Kiritimatiellia bacterium]